MKIKTGSLDPTRAGAACKLCEWATYGEIVSVVRDAESHLRHEHRAEIVNLEG